MAHYPSGFKTIKNIEINIAKKNSDKGENIHTILISYLDGKQPVILEILRNVRLGCRFIRNYARPPPEYTGGCE